MVREENLFVERIQSEIKLLKGIVKKTSKEEFLKNELLQHAATMALLNIGEMSNRLNDDTKNKNEQIEWLRIIGLRNIIVHEYGVLKMELVWRYLTDDIPRFEKALKKVEL